MMHDANALKYGKNIIILEIACFFRETPLAYNEHTFWEVTAKCFTWS